MVAGKIRTRVWRNGILEAEDFPFEDISDYLDKPDCLVWADLLHPDHDTLRQLAEELSLDQHAVEDALARRERPKASRYATHMFLTAYVVSHDRVGGLQIGRVSAFSTKRGFVTVRLDDKLDMDAVLARWDDNSDLIKYGPRTLVHGLLDKFSTGISMLSSRSTTASRRSRTSCSRRTPRPPGRCRGPPSSSGTRSWRCGGRSCRCAR